MTEEKTVCETCRKPAASAECALCANPLCEDCVMAPETGAFHLLPKIPQELSHTAYCRFCYDEKVEPELEKYGETLARAKEVYIFFKTQRKEIPLIRKSKDVFRVAECDDRDETILRLAFMAAAQGYNAVVETEALDKKVRNYGYQVTQWSGSGSPAMIDEEKLSKQDRRNQIYR